MGLFTYGLFSQSNFQSVIVDVISKKPIPYCNVYVKGKIGSVSNEKGQCFLNLSGIDYKDTVVISNLIYYTKKIPLRLLSQREKNDTVFLTPKTNLLPEILVMDKPYKVVEKGVKKVKFMTDRNCTYRPAKYVHEEFAVFIKNDFSKRKIALLESVRCYVIDSTTEGSLFRVKVYNVNQEKMIPGKPLLLDNVLQRHPMTNGWVEVDLSAYNIKMPKEGLFVSIEYVDFFIPKLISTGSNSFLKKENNTSNNKNTCQFYQEDIQGINHYNTWMILQGSEYKHRQNLTWIYGVKSGWRRDAPVLDDSVTDNVCISAKFRVYKK